MTATSHPPFEMPFVAPRTLALDKGLPVSLLSIHQQCQHYRRVC